MRREHARPQPPAGSRRYGGGAEEPAPVPGAGRGHRPPNPAAWTPRTTPSPTWQAQPSSSLDPGGERGTGANNSPPGPSDRAAGHGVASCASYAVLYQLPALPLWLCAILAAGLGLGGAGAGSGWRPRARGPGPAPQALPMRAAALSSESICFIRIVCGIRGASRADSDSRGGPRSGLRRGRKRFLCQPQPPPWFYMLFGCYAVSVAMWWQCCVSVAGSAIM
jgi:hypothetical protein